MKNYYLIFGMLLLLIGCATETQPTSEEEAVTEIEEEETANEEKSEEDIEVVTSEQIVLAENLNAPWSIEKEHNIFYISERPGTILKVAEGETTRQEVELTDELATVEEAGFLGFVLAPDFETTQQAFAYYTYVNESGQFNRIITLTLMDNVWREETILLDKIPSGPYHHGGRIKIGPDNKLYATTGDALESPLAQDLNSLGGKILRLNLDGSIPDDNPIDNSYVYSYGHRNAQGLTWLTDNTLYASEHGDQANDEINLIEPGENYGWPIIEGTQEQEGLTDPEFTSGSETTWAPSGMDADENKLYVAGLRGNAVYIFDLETGEEQTVLTDLGRIR